MVTALCCREDVCCITRRNKITDKVVSCCNSTKHFVKSIAAVAVA